MVFINGFTFNNNDKYEYKNLILMNPDKTELAIITPSVYSDMKLTLRFNSFSELTFKVYSQIAQNISDKNYDNYEYYDLFVKNRIVEVTDIGRFIIKSVKENVENNKTYTKEITCYSLEHSLTAKFVNLIDGTYKFYNNLNPSDTETLMGKIISNLPNWSIGHVDSELWQKYRTFEMPTTNVYDFLMNNVEDAYECIFVFDTFNQTINAYTPSNSVTDTDIVLTFDNLIKEVNIEETDTEIVTALAVYGGGDLDIRNVNPLGTAFIYNFDYYKSWFSDDLRTALELWENKVEDSKVAFSKNLSDLKTYKAELLALESKLNTLKEELKAIDQLRTAQMPNVLSSTTKDYNAKEAEIASQENLVAQKQKEIDNIQATLNLINKDCQFTNNFTEEQLKELDTYIFENTYQNENYIQTDIMTSVDIQNMSEQLLEQGYNELKIQSQPTLTFSMNAVNFLFQKKFQPFIDEIGFQLGSVINVEYKPNQWVYPILLEMVIDFDNPSSFSMTFGNRFRLKTAEWSYAELANESRSATANVNANSSLWSKPVKSGILDEVSDYMTNSLNLINQDIINNKDGEVSIGNYGIRCREKLSDGKYSDIQTWIYNKGMAFTTDGWLSAKGFFGTITNPSGNKSTGLIADSIVGKLLAGNELVITNENNSFKVDGSGATLVNANFTLKTNDNTSEIILDPVTGIKIRTNSGTWKDSFYVDTSGNLTINGKIIADTGKIGGWTLSKDGFINGNNGDYIKSNGYVQLGMLTMTPSSARFDGNIYAKNIRDKFSIDLVDNLFEDNSISDTKIGSLTADKITTGTLTVGGNVAVAGTINGATCNLTNLNANNITSGTLTSININWGANGVNGYLRGSDSQVSMSSATGSILLVAATSMNLSAADVTNILSAGDITIGSSGKVTIYAGGETGEILTIDTDKVTVSVAPYDVPCVRNSYAGTTDLEDGVSRLKAGTLYFVIE